MLRCNAMHWRPVLLPGLLISLSLLCMCAPPAGPPPDTDNQFCPPDAENCYFMSKATANYAGASNTCLNMKGQLVSWNDYDEQLQVGRPRVGSDTQQA
jgi:hypothetical protein